MRHLVKILLLTLVQLPSFGQISEHNDPVKYPSLTNQATLSEIQNKPIEYYLNLPTIGETAKLFYKGEYAIHDDEGTFRIIDSVLTMNEETRPFYFFLFNEIVKLSDGAIAEYMSSVCTNYILRNSCEFLRHSKEKTLEIDVDKWTTLVAFDLHDEKNFQEFENGVKQSMDIGCEELTGEWNEIKNEIGKNLEQLK
jgi:hypothetical protein